MVDANSFKIASELIRRILEAADKGELYYLQQLRSVRRTGAPSRRQSGQAQIDLMQESNVQVDGQSDRARPLDRKKSSSSYSEEYLTGDFSRFESKEELKAYLQKRHPTKSAIIDIARALHVPAPKTDDYDALLDRVIEATLGYKLRSRAVRGPSSGRASSEPES